jgi:hypothetical protein
MFTSLALKEGGDCQLCSQFLRATHSDTLSDVPKLLTMSPMSYTASAVIR